MSFNEEQGRQRFGGITRRPPSRVGQPHQRVMRGKADVHKEEAASANVFFTLPPYARDFYVARNNITPVNNAGEITISTSIEIPSGRTALLTGVRWAYPFMPLDVDTTHSAELYIKVDGVSADFLFSTDKQNPGNFSVPWNQADWLNVWEPVQANRTIEVVLEYYYNGAGDPTLWQGAIELQGHMLRDQGFQADLDAFNTGNK